MSRTIAITGGAQGIGRMCALLCARRGDRIAIFDNNMNAGDEAVPELLAAGAEAVIALACDVSNEAQIEEGFAAVNEKLGPPWGVFANAGVDQAGWIHELPLASWKKMLDVNLTGVFLTCKHALRMMLDAGQGGSIVCTSSPGGFVAFSAGAAGAYSATKGGISSLVRCMAVDYASKGIRVNAVVPGATETRLMWGNTQQDAIPKVREQLKREIPLGRLADPEDPAKAVLWLLSDESSYVTGSHLMCDGGVLAKASISV